MFVAEFDKVRARPWLLPPTQHFLANASDTSDLLLNGD
jgi:hypothetical protein